MNIFFTSDTHFGHRNIIRFCNRPFNSVEEMDETIISNWNAVVNKKDTVYHLGDFCTWKTKDYLSLFNHYRKRLNGKIFLIEGNHDYKINTNLSKIPISNYGLVDKSPLYHIKINKQTIVMCHFAMRVWHKSHFDSWHIYGHSHAKLSPIGKSWDVGVDNNNFIPVSFYDLKRIMESQSRNENWLRELPGYNQEEFEAEKNKEN